MDSHIEREDLKLSNLNAELRKARSKFLKRRRVKEPPQEQQTARAGVRVTDSVSQISLAREPLAEHRRRDRNCARPHPARARALQSPRNERVPYSVSLTELLVDEMLIVIHVSRRSG